MQANVYIPVGLNWAALVWGGKPQGKTGVEISVRYDKYFLRNESLGILGPTLFANTTAQEFSSNTGSVALGQLTVAH